MSKAAATDLLDLVISRAPKLRDAGFVLREVAHNTDGTVIIKLDPAQREVDTTTTTDPPKKRDMWNDPDLFPDDDDERKPAPKEPRR